MAHEPFPHPMRGFVMYDDWDGYKTPERQSAPDEPVAQQPPPRTECGPWLCRRCGDRMPSMTGCAADDCVAAPLFTAAAQQPEAPTLADDPKIIEVMDAYRGGGLPKWSNGDCLMALAAKVESDAERIRGLEAERERRNKVDPITRLHNFVDGLQEEREGSPYSAEAWEAQDAAYREKCAELAASRERERQIREALREPLAGNAVAIIERILATPDSAAPTTGKSE